MCMVLGKRSRHSCLVCVGVLHASDLDHEARIYGVWGTRSLVAGKKQERSKTPYCVSGLWQREFERVMYDWDVC
ncbi:uncharacterized protein BDR25DRAFT_304816 [Lindgomyces ingoldianus]|uniref:Uncharacterized protein n=1 Tax=Lindgomyces ingoldianus TaxID=673940 RepID=A0ACB6QRE2_9PLEO|nr:uncharacterized protein BDR25DRAFT_304816 [Lindgomyces ingoldianus]KAF2468867.1 hypothetical protein BDR25DRAFT_304816 [Lindgomyces ingoldianus]